MLMGELPDEIMDIIFEHSCVYTLVVFNWTCKKYRSEYVVAARPAGWLFVSWHMSDNYNLLVTKLMCEQILHNPHILTIYYGGLDVHISTHIKLPRVVHPFTAMMLRKVVANYKGQIYFGWTNLAWARSDAVIGAIFCLIRRYGLIII